MAATITTVPRKTAQAPHVFVPPFPPAGGIAAQAGRAVPVCFFILTPSAGAGEAYALPPPLALSYHSRSTTSPRFHFLRFLVVSYPLGCPYKIPHLMIDRESSFPLLKYHATKFRGCQVWKGRKWNPPKTAILSAFSAFRPAGGRPAPTLSFGGFTQLTAASLLARFALADLHRSNIP